MSEKSVEVHKSGDTWVVTIMINLVSQYFSAVKFDLKSCLEQLDKDPDWKEITVDMTQSDMVDSSGIGILVSLYKRYVKRKKKFRMIHCNQVVCETLELCNLFQTFHVNQEAEPDSGETKTTFFVAKYVDDSWFFYPQVNLNIYNISTMRKELVEIFKEKQNANVSWTELVFNLENIETVDSAAIGVLLGVFRRTKGAGKQFKIIGCSQAIYGLLEAIGVNQLFSVEMRP
ncbi:MAG: STAS domain-containing protein [SAR324 cluster bacterium]|nr:STAS domain-containing protein [SAR324 cluster bacterium]